MKWGKTFVIHPYLIGLFPVLFLYSRNVAEMRFEGILLPALVILLGVAFLDLFMRPLGWDCHRRALWLSLLLSLFFSFGPLNEMVRTLLFNGTQESAWPTWLVSVLSVAFLGLATLRLSRYRGDLSRLTQLVNAVALVLIMVQVGSAIHGWSGRGNTITSDTYEPTAFLDNDRNPDIYLIVLDAYARSDILQELYDYDNGEFIDNLRQRGFYVADSSRSNYVSTAQSLTSLLNMNYLHRFMATDARQFSRLPTALMLENNRVTAFLKKYGYQTVAFATGYAPTEIDYADYYLKSGVTLSEFENHLLNQTPLPLLLGRFRSQFDLHRDRTRFMLEELPRIPLITGPKFVFAHIDCPHPPFVFDEAGNEIERNWPFSFADGDHYVGARGTLSQYREGYVGQVKFISKQITEIIDTILARSSEPPVILLQADHGPGSRLHWESLADTDLNERFSIFNSYYLPGSDSSGLYPSISPVNSFRLILNKYFGTNFEMIADRQIFTTWTRPYNFVDVSERFGIPETVE